MKLGQICQIFRSFFGQWSFKKKCFWDLLTFKTKQKYSKKFLTVVVVVVLDATEAACISKLLSLFSKLLRSSCSFMSCLLRSETEGAAAVFPVLELPVWFWYISLPLDGAAVVSDSALTGISDVISRLVTLVLNVFEINLFFFSLGLVVSSDPPVWPPPPTEFPPPPPGEVKPCWERL